jgi:AcrR family transcriptional regulator
MNLYGKGKDMSGAVLDRRVQKTLQLLQNALVELIPERGYDAVTIQEILDKANVGRSTFYAHYENKDQLLHSILIRLNEVFEERNQQLAEGKLKFGDHNDPNLPFKLLLFVEQNRHFFKALLEKQGNSSLNKPVYEYLFNEAYQHLGLLIPHQKGDTLRLEMVAHYYVSAFIGVLVWWLEKDLPYSVEAMGQLLKQLTLPGLKNIL